MIGTTVSHYKILEKIGEGGMGVVYKAQDTNLDREVALKFLPERLSGSEQDRARFLQEARAASALNHPNVCTIFGIEEHEKQMFIVMELVEGQTLTEKKGAIGFKQTVEIGIQLSEGLAAAHEKGIVHRDIKPDNIMIRKDGIAQIMDFGLAKLRGVSRLTKEGSTVGTAGYMSPEQVQGQDVDHRADIFSLGVVLYELFTGQLPFRGVHETALMYEIVNVDPPPMSAIKPEIDSLLDAVVLECMEKDPNERTQSVRQVAVDLKRYKRESSRSRVSRVAKIDSSSYRNPAGEPLRPGRMTGHRSMRFLPWMFAVIGLLGMVTFAFFAFRHQDSKFGTIRSFILAPEKANFYFYGQDAGPVMISPNGEWLTFAATDSQGVHRLYVRNLRDLESTELAGTEGAHYPFWSPDSRFIGYFGDNKLRKVEVQGGPSVTICDAPNGRGGSWNAQGQIVFSPLASSPLFVVSASGGDPKQITTMDSLRKEQTHRWPYFLPDGEHFLYHARTAVTGAQTESDAICLASLDGKVSRILVAASSNAAFGADHLLFMRGSTLVAQSFDTDKLTLRGDAVPIADEVLNDAGFNLAVFSVSQNGILVYQKGSAQAGSRLVLCDATGKEIKDIGEVTEFYTPRISPDGNKVAVGTFDAKSRNQDIWVYEIGRGIRTRFTFSGTIEFTPLWSPDGSRIVFSSLRNGINQLFEKSATGAGNEQPLYESDEQKNPTDWSPDGNYILYDVQSDNTKGSDIGLLSLSNAGQFSKSSTFLAEPFNELDAVFSPDGRWVAYTSDESGQEEVYVRPFPGPGGKWQVSTDGGKLPRWPRYGKELYYFSRNTIMAATLIPEATSIKVSSIRPVFKIRPITTGTIYDITSDGKQFVINTRIDPTDTSPITMVLNWSEELRGK
ncbi:MAG: protein kinase [Bacteroidetes bacterium]|nr:protein kinase [Bacteroidota bacterium]